MALVNWGFLHYTDMKKFLKNLLLRNHWSDFYPPLPPEKAAGDMVIVSVRPSVLPSFRLSVLPSHIFVWSISPKVFQISTSNFTSG